MGELADLCEYYAVSENNNYVAQRIWSNKAAAAGTQPCVPSFGEPYAAVSPSPDGVITLEPNQKIEITLSGWTDVPTQPFSINAENYGPSLLMATFNPTYSLSTDTLQNGQTAKLTISVPAGTPSGSVGQVVIYAGLSDDNFGYWPLLVAVPLGERSRTAPTEGRRAGRGGRVPAPCGAAHRTRASCLYAKGRAVLRLQSRRQGWRAC